MKNFIFIFLIAVLIYFSGCNQENNPVPSPTPGGGQDLKYDFDHFTPKLITSDGPEEIILEVRNQSLTGTSATLSTAWNTTITLTDDGKAPDKNMGDKIFTAIINKSLILNQNTSQWLNRPLIGRLNIGQGYLSVFAEVYSDVIPLLNVKSISATMQQTTNLVNIVSNEISPDNLSKYLRTFYASFPDQYDFVHIIYPGFTLNRYHLDVKIDINGIGKDELNNSANYGSAGKLIGINVFPNTVYYDGASRAYMHELGHQWINFMRGLPTESGIPHWPLSDLAGSIMGYSPGGGQGLEFRYDLIKQSNDTWLMQQQTMPQVFNDLELYLMGLIPIEEVLPHIVFTNTNQTQGNGKILNGPVTPITKESVIALLGNRVPDHTTSPKQFRIATIIISNALLSAKEMSFYDYYTKRATLKEEVFVVEGNTYYQSKPFYLSTQSKAELIVGIE